MRRMAGGALHTDLCKIRNRRLALVITAQRGVLRLLLHALIPLERVVDPFLDLLEATRRAGLLGVHAGHALLRLAEQTLG